METLKLNQMPPLLHPMGMRKTRPVLADERVGIEEK
jgi:hypothetical protein